MQRDKLFTKKELCTPLQKFERLEDFLEMNEKLNAFIAYYKERQRRENKKFSRKQIKYILVDKFTK